MLEFRYKLTFCFGSKLDWL